MRRGGGGQRVAIKSLAAAAAVSHQSPGVREKPGKGTKEWNERGKASTAVGGTSAVALAQIHRGNIL